MFNPLSQRALSFSFLRPMIAVMILGGIALFSSCATSLEAKAPLVMKKQPCLTEKEYISFDGDSFGYQKWGTKGVNPSKVDVVIIGIHGISGHAGDYDNLGKFLEKQNKNAVFYAAETRGQGMDVKRERRGDIRDVKEWYRDLYTFSGLVGKRYPKAKIIWFGESMGSLIAAGAYGNNKPREKRPDALVLSSPIVGINEKLSIWQLMLANTAAVIFPKFRISLESLAPDVHPKVTKEDIHEQQAAKNPWYIKRYTLRLLLALEKISKNLDKEVAQMNCPVLILHGGLDIFSTTENVKKLLKHFPQSSEVTWKLYPDSYHLLMYDHRRETIFKDISNWLKKR